MINCKILKHEIAEKCLSKIDEVERFLSLPREGRQIMASALLMEGFTIEEVESSFFRQNWDYGNTLSILQDAKPIVFSSDQAMVFANLSETYSDSLDYKLPFSDVLLQFDKPIRSRRTVIARGTSGKSQSVSGISALVLRQIEMTKDEFDQEVRHVEEAIKVLQVGGKPSHQKLLSSSDDKIIQNVISVVFDSLHVIRVGWQSGVTNESFIHDIAEREKNTELSADLIWAKNLATACIGYINCENIYLHQEGGAPEKVNRKRESKGKSRLEPYYVCRIRGVNYDSVATGTGSAHHIRYDVRGHFRRLTTGKTTWVRPHQRGLQNELYIPKTYKVDKGSKPAWNNTPSQ